MMKAAVLHEAGQVPRFEDFAEPLPGPGQVTLSVLAASIKNIDRMMAKGSHYAAGKLPFPRVVGIDGVGTLPDGRLVYAGSPLGMMAERALVSPEKTLPVPTGLDPAVAAALPNPALSAWFALNGRAALQPGETVFVLGATGVTGKLAIQIAKQMGAGRIVAAGRSPEGLRALRELGADEVISLNQSEGDIQRAVAAQHRSSHFDLVLDYLWGRPAELVLEALTGHDLAAEAHRTRYVQIGEMAGPTINLPGAALRSSAIEISGQGGGSVSKELMARVGEVLPSMFRMAAEGKLRIEVEQVALKDVEAAWSRPESGGKRLVVMTR